MKRLIEYMIEDWIMVEGKPVQIAAIHQKKVGYHKWEGRLSWVRLDQIQTIPLTSELLLKNGFKLDWEGYYIWKQVGESFYIILEELPRGIWNIIIEDNNQDEQTRKEVYGKSLKLHHLQHEFVLGGVKKEFIV